MNDNGVQNRIRVIVCRPGERAEVVEIEEELKPMQEIVGGYIQEFMPFSSQKDERFENVAVVCDEEGKIREREKNRAIRDDEGKVQDIIAGTFFICYAPPESERFMTMPPDLEEEFLHRFLLPERFHTRNGVILIQKYDPLQIGDGHDLTR